MSANERTTRKGEVLPIAAELCDVPCFKTVVVTRLRSEMPSDDVLEAVRTRFSALADRTRLEVLHALVDDRELIAHDRSRLDRRVGRRLR